MSLRRGRSSSLLFDEIDLNHDGLINRHEFNEFNRAYRREPHQTRIQPGEPTREPEEGNEEGTGGGGPTAARVVSSFYMQEDEPRAPLRRGMAGVAGVAGVGAGVAGAVVLPPPPRHQQPPPSDQSPSEPTIAGLSSHASRASHAGLDTVQLRERSAQQGQLREQSTQSRFEIQELKEVPGDPRWDPLALPLTLALRP